MLNEAPQHLDVGIYQPRNPHGSDYYRCVQDHFEQLAMCWEDRYAPRYGFWRPYVTDVIYRYLDCGDLHLGFTRVRCADCGHEYLLAYSCKRRHFCPSCHQKRVVEFGEWLCTQVFKLVPHRQWVLSIPKRLRRYFLFDRKLLAKLSRCAWNVLSAYLKQSAPLGDAVPGAAIAVHTFGDFLQFNPHLHIIATDGCFSSSGAFTVGPGSVGRDLEELFRKRLALWIGWLDWSPISQIVTSRWYAITATIQTNRAACGKRRAAMTRSQRWSSRQCPRRHFGKTGLD
jgi:hypothetical protein